jgi:hypothetical protein
MNLNLELYINNQKVEFYDFEQVEINSSIKDVKDVSKVFTDFSREIKVPASKNNNKIFKHYYNWDIINGFDARLRYDAIMRLNGFDYKEGKISLLGVDLENDQPKSYNIVFYGKTINLKDLLEDDMLDDLGTNKADSQISTTLNDFTFTYSPSFVQDCFMYGYEYTGGTLNTASTTFPTAPISPTDFDVCFPFISGESFYYLDSNDTGKLSPKDKVDSRNVDVSATLDTDLRPKRGVWFKDLKPAVRVKWIIKAIEERYDIEFSDEFFNDSTNVPFEDLFLWLSRESGNIDKQLEETSASFILSDLTSTGFYDWRGENYGTNSNNTPTNDQLELFATEVNGQYNPRIKYRVSFDIDVAGDGNFTIKAENELDNTRVRIINYEQEFSDAGTSGATYTFDIEQNMNSFESGFDLAQPKVTISTQGGITAISSITNLTIERIQEDFGNELSLGTGTYTLTTPSLGTSKSNIVAQMPKMKVIDFLTSLFKMFNLTAYYEPENSQSTYAGKIRVRQLDDYYKVDNTSIEKANTVDLTEFADTSNYNVNRFAIYKNIDYEFSEPKSFAIVNANEIREARKNDSGGRYDFGNERIRLNIGEGDYKTDVGFEKMMFERMSNQNTADLYDSKLTWGWSANREENATLTKPILFYPIKTPVYTDATDYIIFDQSDYNEDGSRDGAESITDDEVNFFIRPSNSHIMSTYGVNGKSINFGSELDEHTRKVNDDSLYETYHKTYIENIYNERTRLFKLSMHLPLRILLSLELNDEVIIKQRKYNINSMRINLMTGKADFELITRASADLVYNPPEEPATTPPTITILGDNPAYVNYGDTYTDAGATADDAEDGDLTGSIVTTQVPNPIDTSDLGDFQYVNYRVTDSDGYIVERIREVIVQDVTAPTSVSIVNATAYGAGDLQYEDGTDVPENVRLEITATDNESGIDYYAMYYRKTFEPKWRFKENTTDTIYFFLGLQSCSFYDFKFIAYDKAGNSTESLLKRVYTNCGSVAPPLTTIDRTDITIDNDTITIDTL